MHAFPLKQNRDRGFTLIELLVVITIIVILVAIFFPVMGAVSNRGRVTQAVSDEHNLMTAIFAYQSDYNKLPSNPDQESGATTGDNFDTVYGDPGPNQLYPGYELIDVLRGLEEPKYNAGPGFKMNPNKVAYFDAPNAKDVKEPRHGIVTQSYFDGKYTINPGSLVDPWGSEYVVWLDVAKDRDLNKAMRWFYNNYPEGKQYGPTGSVQIGSMGPDGDFGKNGNVTGSDDILVVQ